MLSPDVAIGAFLAACGLGHVRLRMLFVVVVMELLQFQLLLIQELSLQWLLNLIFYYSSGSIGIIISI